MLRMVRYVKICYDVRYVKICYGMYGIEDVWLS